MLSVRPTPIAAPAAPLGSVAGAMASPISGPDHGLVPLKS
jgi:hypothetical protein